MVRLILLFLFIISVLSIKSQNYCLRFFGNGTGDIDRVKISIDNPEKNVDVGFDFTIEFQMLAVLSENPLGENATQGSNDDWTLGHIIIDRDIFGQGDYGDYGISLVAGKIAFGVNNGTDSYTLIGKTMVADSNWHYIAVTRNSQTGELRIFVDGQLDTAQITNVTGNISYRNNRQTQWNNDPFIVIGAEKHDYDNTTYPSFKGYFDELRISNIVRYNSNYTPVDKFVDDQYTMGLYHFDEGQGYIVHDSALIAGNNSNGIINFGGNPAGPLWVLRENYTNIKNFFESPLIQIFYDNKTKMLFLNNSQNYKVEIYNILGSLQIIANGNSINMYNLPDGIYIVKTPSGGKKIFKY